MSTPLRKKMWFRIVAVQIPEHQAVDCAVLSDTDDEDTVLDIPWVVAVDTKGIGLRLVRRESADEDDALAAANSVWRLSPQGQLICRMYDGGELALDAAPTLRYLAVNLQIFCIQVLQSCWF